MKRVTKGKILYYIYYGLMAGMLIAAIIAFFATLVLREIGVNFRPGIWVSAWLLGIFAVLLLIMRFVRRLEIFRLAQTEIQAKRQAVRLNRLTRLGERSRMKQYRIKPGSGAMETVLAALSPFTRAEFAGGTLFYTTEIVRAFGLQTHVHAFFLAPPAPALPRDESTTAVLGDFDKELSAFFTAAGISANHIYCVRLFFYENLNREERLSFLNFPGYCLAEGDALRLTADKQYADCAVDKSDGKVYFYYPLPGDSAAADLGGFIVKSLALEKTGAEDEKAKNS